MMNNTNESRQGEQMSHESRNGEAVDLVGRLRSLSKGKDYAPAWFTRAEFAEMAAALAAARSETASTFREDVIEECAEAVEACMKERQPTDFYAAVIRNLKEVEPETPALSAETLFPNAWMAPELNEDGSVTPARPVSSLPSAEASGTPRTDAVMANRGATGPLKELADFARQLERELAEARNERDEFRRDIKKLLGEISALSATATTIPKQLFEDLVLWTRQVSEQPRERVAPGVASAAAVLHTKLVASDRSA